MGINKGKSSVVSEHTDSFFFGTAGWILPFVNLDLL